MAIVRKIMVASPSVSVTAQVFNLMMRLLGPDGVAAISILLYLDFLLTAVSRGYSLGAAPLIRYHYSRCISRTGPAPASAW